MPIVKIVKYTGVVCAIDVIESNQKNALVASQVYSVQDIKNVKIVNYVDLKHNTQFN
jgi:hypothetical protein|tara:strand:- start:1950 stop:2120 length:171 start_codon:yes stop_codon:yes gene_type:complete